MNKSYLNESICTIRIKNTYKTLESFAKSYILDSGFHRGTFSIRRRRSGKHKYIALTTNLITSPIGVRGVIMIGFFDDNEKTMIGCDVALETSLNNISWICVDDEGFEKSILSFDVSIDHAFKRLKLMAIGFEADLISSCAQFRNSITNHEMIRRR